MMQLLPWQEVDGTVTSLEYINAVSLNLSCIQNEIPLSLHYSHFQLIALAGIPAYLAAMI